MNSWLVLLLVALHYDGQNLISLFALLEAEIVRSCLQEIELW